MVEFLRWAMHEGQETAPQLDYAPLPPALRKRVLAQIDGIRY
jgi:ABC-type phosphate transport system substrate-binding protein